MEQGNYSDLLTKVLTATPGSKEEYSFQTILDWVSMYKQLAKKAVYLSNVINGVEVKGWYRVTTGVRIPKEIFLPPLYEQMETIDKDLTIVSSALVNIGHILPDAETAIATDLEEC